MARPLKTNQWTANKEFSMIRYYDSSTWAEFYDQGILNPDYVELVK